MRILYLLHTDFELPGAIIDWATEKGLSQSYNRPFAGDQLPPLDTFDLLIIMGGPQSTNDLETYPYLSTEIDFTRNAIHAGKTILGICLGAQIIGTSLGAKTEPSPHKEIGVFPITLTQEGQEDPLLQGLPHEFLVTHWHGEMPGLPPGATLLASSEGCPRQIIRFGKTVYGFQCHPEIKKEDIKRIIECCPDDLTPGYFVQTKNEMLSSDYSPINRYMLQILDNLPHLHTDALESKVRAYKMLSNQIKELEEQKKTLSGEILSMLDKETKTLYIADFRVQRWTRLSIKTSLDDARNFGATKHEEIVDKDAIKRLFELGQPIPNVSIQESVVVYNNTKKT